MRTTVIAKWEINHDEMSVSSRTFTMEVPKSEELVLYYTMIGCRMIDFVFCNGFDIICNDEGLLESGNVVARYTLPDGQTVELAGDLVFAKGVDDEGNTVFFDEDDDMLIAIEDMVRNAEILGVTK